MPTREHPIVGTVSYSVNSNGSLNLLNGWASRNIGLVEIPELKGVPTYGGKFSGKVSFYRRAIPQLKAAFAEIGRRGLSDKIIFWAGSFVPRLMRGGSSPSNHSWGTAFDVNPDQNPFRRPVARRGAKGDLHDVAPILKKYGFTWGGDWRNPDGMHFEVNRILSAAEIAAISGSTPSAPQIPIPEYSGPGFEIVVNGSENIGPGLVWGGKLYGALDAAYEAIGYDVIKSGDLRKRTEQPRFYIVTGEAKE